MVAVLNGLVALLIIITVPRNGFADIIDKAVVRAVVQLATPVRPNGSSYTGTGFLIDAETPSGQVRLGFLVTNKHMIGTYNPLDKGNHLAVDDWIGVRFYTGSVPPIDEVRIDLKGPDGKLDSSRCAIDPDPLVDVAVVRVDDTLNKYPKKRLALQSLSTKFLEPFANLPGAYANIGNRVFALGYPRGVTSLLTNYPVAKSGHLAATAGEELVIRSQPLTWRGKLLLIDGLIVPGNSGGPVLLPGAGATGVNPKTGLFEMKSAGSSLIIGIVSSKTSDDGLVIAFATDYIKSLIDTLVAQVKDTPKPGN